VAILIDTQSEDAKDGSVEQIKAAAEKTQAEFVFTIMEAWGPAERHDAALPADHRQIRLN
jgi:hypothetical protein